ncbi:polymerase delta-interacting protein 3-like [Vanessa atalanta]|uniref:polymerase delta-interacting protein 3-like n=1 Tax=Vanessa atalanta TaxID=42275 RepID=UPI001FCCDEDF|nr:polymerase delta-interacting protein 3-like [Vanessa atalanta]
MASYVDMSLDDIIQKQKRGISRPKSKMKNQSVPAKQKIIDARNKIISKKRTQITDAREKLAELARKKDARLRLEQMRAKRAMGKVQCGGSVNQNHGKFIKVHTKRERVFTDPSRHVVSQPLAAKTLRKQTLTNKKNIGDRSIEARSFAKSSLKPIIRTVENDLEIIDNTMDEEYEPLRKSFSNRKASLQLKIVTHNNEINRTTIVEKEKSPPRPPSILKKRPMAALRIENKTEKLDKPHEYRIIVSNLRSTVTGGDIEELFGDVGGMIESRLVRPGTAEIIYKSVEDAQRAVDLYHNRQLDGQPMNCLLVTPRSTSAATRNSNKPALYSTNSNVEPDISTFHKVLFSNF